VTFTDDLLLLRTFVAPALADDTALEDVYDSLNSSWQATAIHFLRKRRADLVAGPASFAISGEYSESNAEILTELDKMLTQLSGLLPSEPELPDGATVTGGFSVGQIVRCQPR
jgi:hypothetical protein